jgi:hypothetical protein
MYNVTTHNTWTHHCLILNTAASVIDNVGIVVAIVV